MYIPADLEKVVLRLKIAFERGYLSRACIQTALYNGWWEDTVYLIKTIRNESLIPISLSVFPLDDWRYKELIGMGIEELVIPLDACTREIFDKIKGKNAGGPYSWEGHMDGLMRASRIFKKVGTHLMLGLGENDEEAVRIIAGLWETAVNPALFYYTYVPGTQLAQKENQDSVRHYRTVQLARYLIVEGMAAYPGMSFSNGVLCNFGIGKEIVLAIINEGRAFQTSGCAGCNRPMANETYSNIFNFPRKLDSKDIEKIKHDMGIF
ncbi:MAG: radical SAM protein [Candidatus Methanoperedens sp.]|nr:radical SAM protein [Candidatus Methanoperedens sp.]